MIIASRPFDEAARLEALDSLRVLDTAPEAFFDEIADLARELTGVKVAMIAMIDGERKWLKACSGGALGESQRDVSFCSHTILQDDVMWVEDSRLDTRFWDNPLVTGPKQLNFYAGAPIIVGGFKVGTLCLNDETPRPHDAHTAGILTRLATLVGNQLAGRRMELMSAGILAATGDAVVSLDSDRRIIFWNPAAEGLFGYSAEEALGGTLELIDGLSLPALAEELATALVGEALASERTFKTTAVHKDGRPLMLEITAADWLDGNASGLSLMIRDCSDRHRASEALRVALERAEAANIAKSEFLAVMSHEIRTPLNGVLGMAQAMEAGPLSKPQSERLEVLKDSGQTLLGLLNNLLDLSRIEAGKVELELGAFDIRQLGSDVVAGFEAAASAKGIRLALAFEADTDGLLHGDALRLRQVLSNLISNAVKFGESGDVNVKIAHRHGQLSFRVADTGVGIAQDRIQEVFGRFVQADASTTRRFGGSGLGLSICKELVELMGGSISVESSLGAGAVFTVILPMMPAPALRPSAAEHGSRAEARPSATIRVLAAEDNAANQLVLKALLEQLDVELTVVGNGALAVRFWEEQSWDVILMDVQMPEMDGVSATRAIRSGERQSLRVRTPILALTANAMAHQKAEYCSAGMDGLVTKPIDARQLFEAISEVLAGQEDSGLSAPA